MRNELWIGAGLVGFLLIPALVVMFYLRIGPVGPVPASDPLAALNQQHANLTENAALTYQQAFDIFVRPPYQDWFRGCVDWEQDREPGEHWIDENREYYQLIYSASRTKDCWFKIARDPKGFFELPYTGHFRNALRFCKVRAELAATKYELAPFEEAVDVMDRIARHAGERPLVMSCLVGLAGSRMVQDLALRPLGWPGLPEQDRRDYLRRIARWFAPLPSLASAIQTERDEFCWNPLYRANAPKILITPQRFAGELDRFVKPLLKWVAEQPRQQAAPNNPHRAKLNALDASQVGMADPVRSLATLLISSRSSTVDLQLRVIVQQCGNRLASKIHLYALENGVLPENLDVFDPHIKTDPYTAKPFIYWRTESGFTLYSAGLDRDDDRARHHPKFGEGRNGPDGDFVFWPLQPANDP